jgi:hypothetical protein
MDKEMFTEVRLEHKELLFERVLSLNSEFSLDGFLPHSHELPLLELFKEVELLYAVIGISFN